MFNKELYNQPYHDVDLSKYSFLITGGAGFIGSNIVEYLLKYNAGRVRILDNLSNGYIDNIRRFFDLTNFEFIEGDICNLETCRNAVKEIHFISHQAALGSVPRSINDPITTNEVNITGFLNVLTAAKDEKSVRKMIYAASSSTYGDHPGLPKIEDKIGKPLSPYAITKCVNELYGDVFSKTYDFHTIGLRYFNVFGPKQSPDNAYAAVIPLFIKAALENRSATINGTGETSRDFTFVSNAVQGNIKALLSSELIRRHEVINIACGERTTLNELWELICKSMEKEISPKYAIERKGDVLHSLADITKARNLINYHPQVDVKKGIQLLVSEVQKMTATLIP